MTVSVVQSVTVADAPSGSFSTPTTAGNTVIVAVTSSQTANVTMTVTSVTLGGAGGNFAQAVTPAQSGYAGGFTEFAAIWADPNCAGGQTAVAVAGTNLALTGGSDNGFTAYEVAGLVSSSSLASVLDKTASSSGTTGTAVSSGTTAATAQAAEIAVGGLAGGDTLSAFTSGYTVAGINDGGGEYNAAGYKILSATGTQALAATQASSLPWAGVIATFKAATASGAALPAAAVVTATGTAPALPLLLPPAAAVTAAGFALKPPGIQLPAAAAVTGTGYAPRPAAVLPPPAQVTARGTAPALPDLGYPAGNLGARVELHLGSAWTDITKQALPDGQEYATIKSGQPDGAQQPNPASMAAIWDNPDYSLSPRNSAGPYYGQLRQNTPARVSVTSPYGTYLRLENDNSDLASVADTSALHVTGSMEIRLGVRLSDWRACTLAARNDGTTASWSLLLNADGTLSFYWFDTGGTLRHVTSPAASGVSWRAFRATLDATNGNVQFYLSDTIDGSWTSMGAAASGTSGAATSVRAGNSPLVVGWSAVAGTQMRGQVYGFRLYNGLSGSGGTPVADAAFSGQVPGVTTWTDLAGRTWNLSGGAEVTGRDYRLHGELSSLAPTADASSGMPRVQAVISGRLRRLQQASAPVVDSPMRRAILSQAGSLYPVDYWPMEDGQVARSFGPAVGTGLLTAGLGTVRPAADSSFEASAPLPVLNGDALSFTVDTYTAASAWAVRFLWKEGTTLPASGSVRLMTLNTTGACTVLEVSVNHDGSVNFTGKLSGGTVAFTFTEVGYPQLSGPAWWSIEATAISGGVQYNLVALSPGASSGNQDPANVTGHGGIGAATSGTVNPDLALNDSVFGHLSVQKAWASLFTLGQPLNAWRNELAADRFARVCSEQGIACRVLGRPSTTQAMGPQPRGSAWVILRDCAQTEQGFVFEPRDVFGLGLRTKESMGIQQAGVTLSFAAANLCGDLQPVDDDQGFLNDVTSSMPDGTTLRSVLDDGSPASVSEPKDGGRGRYAGSPPFTFNLADASGLSMAASFYLLRVSVDGQRYRNVVLDMGVPGAPAADIARLRHGDLIVITNVPGIYQSADIHQLAMGAADAFGPGHRVTWDCVQSSPYGVLPLIAKARCREVVPTPVAAASAGRPAARLRRVGGVQAGLRGRPQPVPSRYRGRVLLACRAVRRHHHLVRAWVVIVATGAAGGAAAEVLAAGGWHW